MQFLKIADLNIAVDGADNKCFVEKVGKYAVSKPDFIDSKVNFVLSQNICSNEIIPFKSGCGRSFYDDGVNQGFYDYVDEIEKTVSLMKTDYTRKNIEYKYSDISEIFGIESDSAVTTIMGHFFDEILLNHHGITIHASAIVYKGEAVTFTAPSGTGKSTHTGLWKKYYPDTVVINDDIPAIRMIDGNFIAYGTPWSGKTDINENMSAPLKAMVFLERSDENTITEISSAEAFVRMIKELPLPPFKNQSDLMMDMLSKLFSAVPKYLLKCDMSKQAVDVVKNKLF